MECCCTLVNKEITLKVFFFFFFFSDHVCVVWLPYTIFFIKLTNGVYMIYDLAWSLKLLNQCPKLFNRSYLDGLFWSETDIMRSWREGRNGTENKISKFKQNLILKDSGHEFISWDPITVSPMVSTVAKQGIKAYTKDIQLMLIV